MRDDQVIFLDIDGPMIPSTQYLVDNMCGWKREFPAHTIALINYLCEQSQTALVINSTHNMPMPEVLDIIPALIKAGVKEEYFHSHPQTNYPQFKRRDSVENWLLKHPEVKKWIAIDDDPFVEGDHMIFVDHDRGLGIKHLNQALTILGGKKVFMLL